MTFRRRRTVAHSADSPSPSVRVAPWVRVDQPLPDSRPVGPIPPAWLGFGRKGALRFYLEEVTLSKIPYHVITPCAVISLFHTRRVTLRSTRQEKHDTISKITKKTSKLKKQCNMYNLFQRISHGLRVSYINVRDSRIYVISSSKNVRRTSRSGCSMYIIFLCGSRRKEGKVEDKNDERNRATKENKVCRQLTTIKEASEHASPYTHLGYGRLSFFRTTVTTSGTTRQNPFPPEPDVTLLSALLLLLAIAPCPPPLPPPPLHRHLPTSSQYPTTMTTKKC